MNAKLHYLTVPDLVWVNLQLTKSPQKFSYATLEEAVFYQYAYRDSSNLFAQAARLMVGFAQLSPFAAGNKATSLVATAGFLAFNGYELHVPNAEWLESVLAEPEEVLVKIEAACQRIHTHMEYGVPDAKPILRGVMVRHEAVIEELLRSEPVAELI